MGVVVINRGDHANRTRIAAHRFLDELMPPAVWQVEVDQSQIGCSTGQGTARRTQGWYMLNLGACAKYIADDVAQPLSGIRHIFDNDDFFQRGAITGVVSGISHVTR